MTPEDQTLLTTHALGEALSPEEQARVDQLLATDPEAVALVAEFRQLGGLLASAYQAEPLPAAALASPIAPVASEAAPAAKPERKLTVPGGPKPIYTMTPEQRKARVELLKSQAPGLKRSKILNYQAVLTSLAACLVLVGLLYAMNIVQILLAPAPIPEEELVKVDLPVPDDFKPSYLAELEAQIESEITAEEAILNAQHDALASIELPMPSVDPVEPLGLPGSDPMLQTFGLAGTSLRQAEPALAAQVTPTADGDLVMEYQPMPPNPRERLGITSAPPKPAQKLDGVVASSPEAVKEALGTGGEVAKIAAPSTPAFFFEQSVGAGVANSVPPMQMRDVGYSYRRVIPSAPGVAMPASAPGPTIDDMEVGMVPGATTLPTLAFEVSDLDVDPNQKNELTISVDDPAPASREAYDVIAEKPFVSPKDEPLSTFSVDVDTASYANVRRFLEGGRLPPAGAVRIEELVNYFRYHDQAPTDREQPLAVSTELAKAPWAPEHQLMRVAIRGYEMPWSERPPANLVFLVDVSGSMEDDNKLPLVKAGLKELVAKLDERDRVAIVTYAGYSELALPSTTANNRETIDHAIDQLGAGGSTNGAGGIKQAYEVARRFLQPDYANRVILCTDGDFNVGTTSRSELVDLIEREAKTGVYLTILGFGMDNYQDATLEELSNKGNGNYAYIDDLDEAKRVLVDHAAGTLVPIAKDVKIQVEFNPEYIQAYRLVGYENRALAAQDFNDDQKDAGEIGSGHQVIALYELIPVGVDWKPAGTVDDLKYQPKKEATRSGSGEIATVKLRYKPADASAGTADGFAEASVKHEFAVRQSAQAPAITQVSEDFRFSVAVAGFGQKLRGSPSVRDWPWTSVQQLARTSAGEDPARQEFLTLVKEAARLQSEK